MKAELLEILVCPMCRGQLALTTTQEANGEIVAGALRCQSCSEKYLIEDGIPNLLPPDLRD